MLNIYAVVILAALFLEYILGLISSQLNLRSLSERPPQELEGLYDEDAYRKSQQYTRDSTRLGRVSSTFSLLALLIFWFAGGFNWVDLWVRSLGWGEMLGGIAYIGVLALASSAASLPFSIYNTFVLEERYGFNKTTAGVFVADLLKGLGLAVVLGGALLTAVLAFFHYAGQAAWLYCWTAATGWIFFIQFIAPTWIMPLFNKFEPLAEGELRDSLMEYAKKVGFPLQNVYVLDGSRRSSRANAFFMGLGRSKRVALYDTLIEQQSVPEMVAVLAHEIGHYKKHHVAQGILISIVHTGVLFWLLSIFISHSGLFAAFGMQHQSIYAGLLFFGLLFSPIELLLSIVLQVFSRRNEHEADRFACRTSSAEHLVSGLKKLARENLDNLTPHPLHVLLHYSHPPLLKRIQHIRQLEG